MLKSLKTLQMLQNRKFKSLPRTSFVKNSNSITLDNGHVLHFKMITHSKYLLQKPAPFPKSK